jgi:hypothetical protein
MDASPIVMQLDVARNVLGGLLSCRVDHVVDTLVLEAGEERLGERVIPAHAGSTERVPEPKAFERRQVLGGSILRAMPLS